MNEKVSYFYFCIYSVSTLPLSRVNVITTDSGNYENKSFAHDAHSIEASEYHLQWATKYRYKTPLKESHYKGCETALKNAAERHETIVKESSAMPNHVNIIMFLPLYSPYINSQKYFHNHLRNKLLNNHNFKAQNRSGGR